MSSRFRFISNEDSKSEYLNKVIKYVNSKTETSQEEKLKMYDVFIKLPYHLRYVPNFSRKKVALRRLKHISKQFTKDEFFITHDTLNKFNLNDFNIEKYLRIVLKVPRHKKNLLNELEKYQKFIDEFVKSEKANIMKLNDNYFENAIILKEFYKKNKINESTYNYHKILTLYTLKFFKFNLDNMSRLEIIDATLRYYYDLKIRYIGINNMTLDKLLNLVNDFSDYCRLPDEELWDIERIKFEAIEEFSITEDVEREIITLNTSLYY